MPVRVDNPGAARALARRLPTFREFVEEALFHPRWGYYATGAVRFGDGGHYDTFPIALSPLFGRMILNYAYRRWTAWGRPARFDLCEIGAGNGQLCLDVLAWLDLRAGRDPDWRRFARALRYRIIEKSPALAARQRAQLGPFAARVEWEAADLSRRASRSCPRRFGVVVANEVLDCLAHDKVALGRDGRWRVAHVGMPAPASRPRKPAFLSRRAMAAALARARPGLRFAEVMLPIECHPRIARFMRRHHAEVHSELRRRRRSWTYFACPPIETFVRNTARLYRHADLLLIDYGGERDFHLAAPPSQRLRAGRPEDGASIFRAPGRDDITFLVDFSVVARAAEDCGLRVVFLGPQGRLARLGGVRLTPRSAEMLIKRRALAWALAVIGVGPESEQRRGALSWTKPRRWRAPRTLAEEVSDAIEQFLGRRPSTFHLMAIEKRPGSRATSETHPRAARGSVR